MQIHYLPRALFIFLASAASTQTLACSCGEMPTLNALYEAHPTVAVIEVTKLELKSEMARYTDASTGERSERVQKYVIGRAKVIEALKGRSPNEVEVIGSTPTDGCFTGQQVGEYYLVFMSKNKVAEFSACSATTPIGSVPAELLKEWRGKNSNK